MTCERPAVLNEVMITEEEIKGHYTFFQKVIEMVVLFQLEYHNQQVMETLAQWPVVSQQPINSK